jgi:predicted  nucleic acid-binding Zn-ribbon protein
MPAIDPAIFRKRFHELAAERAKVEKTAKPHRDKYESLRKEEQAIAAKQDSVVAKMKEAEAPLQGIVEEMAMLARALNGRTGSPESPEL